MSYVVHFGDLQTGAIYGDLPCVSASCSDELRAAGSFRAVIPLNGSREIWSALTNGPADMWAVEWVGNFGRRVVAAGPLLPMSFDANGVTLAGAGLWWVFHNRMTIHRDWTPSTPTAAPAPIWTMTGWELGTIMQLICQETTATVDPYAGLPITWETERSGSHDRTYYPYDIVPVAQRVKEIGDVEVGTDGKGGPDWGLLPQFTTDAPPAVTWRFLTGTQAQPMLFGDDAPLALDAAAPGQNILRNLTGARDGSRKVTRVFSSGGGTESSKIVKVTEQANLTAGIRIDAVITNDALNQDTVQGYSDAEFTKRNRTPAELAVEVDAEWWWRNNGTVGKPVRLLWRGHPIVGDLDVTTRVTKWDADVSSRWVKLGLADTTAAI